MKRFAVTLGITALFMASLAGARSFTLAQAVDFALAHNSMARLAKARRAAASAELRLARDQGIPEISASYGYLLSNNPLEALSAELERRQVSATAFTPTTLNHPGITKLGTTTLSLSWPLYTGGALTETLRAGRYGHEAARSAALRIRQSIMAQVVQSYEGVLVAREGLVIARKAVVAARRHARTTRYLYAHGRIVRSDALSAAVNLGASEGMLAEAHGNVRIAMDNLAMAMGAPAGLAITVPPAALPVVPIPRKGLAAFYRQALTDRPDIKALRTEISALHAQAQAARDRSSFQVRLTAESQWFSEIPNLNHNAWTVGAVVSKSLYDGHRNRDRADVLEQRAIEIQAKLAGLRARIRNHVARAFDDMRTAMAQYRIANANVARARQTVALTQVRYGEGRTILLSLLNAENGLVQAREARLAALYALAANRTALAATCGRLSRRTLASLGVAS
ncbi:TolC family protein [Acidiferrobacter sp.]|uniref:TolC family protein n=1 Tax=Acidiferrobacter sp. TaxID=1872107 RepID=UPI00261F70A6|nr:TolC family protein [Acidiferrobacter sp.]